MKTVTFAKPWFYLPRAFRVKKVGKKVECPKKLKMHVFAKVTKKLRKRLAVNFGGMAEVKRTIPKSWSSTFKVKPTIPKSWPLTFNVKRTIPKSWSLIFLLQQSCSLSIESSNRWEQKSQAKMRCSSIFPLAGGLKIQIHSTWPAQAGLSSRFCVVVAVGSFHGQHLPACSLLLVRVSLVSFIFRGAAENMQVVHLKLHLSLPSIPWGFRDKESQSLCLKFRCKCPFGSWDAHLFLELYLWFPWFTSSSAVWQKEARYVSEIAFFVSLIFWVFHDKREQSLLPCYSHLPCFLQLDVVCDSRK